ncbi:hypothetical protein IE53DRAFT_316947 [Violaceomyces palustris]|uniref:Uncharacterized protein n=1 Tax=Violaceomyces palustris TaxID=1673888 RepID=A0ACD0NVJ7_9BASI|nr:hypothetical protein IE53DRAFT_316947 [Violaceomyces palustris]
MSSASSSQPLAAPYKRWEPLPKILYGFAIHPFSPDTDPLEPPPSLQFDQLSQGARENLQNNLISLEVGDEVYVFEQLGHQDVSWFRGYVVSTHRLPVTATSASSLSDYSALPATLSATSPGASSVEEPQVYVGLFPASHVHIREQLDDAELRLAAVHAQAKEAGIVGAIGPPGRALVNSHMETLPEEDESVSQPASPRRPLNGAGTRLSEPVEKPPPPLPSLKCGDETFSGATEPLVDEIACALREWGTLMYLYLGRRDYALFHTVREHIEVLHGARRQLLAQTLSADEVAKLRRECVARLVKGNVAQGLDVIVRHPGRGGLVDVDFTGRESDPESWVSGIRLYALQVALAYVDQQLDQGPSSTGGMDLATSNAFDIASPTTSSAGVLSGISSNYYRKPANLSRSISAISRTRSGTTPSARMGSSVTSTGVKYFHVYLELKALVASPCNAGETAEFYFSLYNRAEARFLTEEFCVILNHQGASVKESEGRLGKSLFTDLSANDMQDLNVVCRIVRNGAMRLGSSEQRPSQTLHDQDTPPSVDPLLGTEGSMMGSAAFRTNRMTSDRSFRRPFGCAVLELGQHHQFQTDVNTSSSIKEHVMPIFVPVNEAAFSTLHQDIIASRIKEFEKSQRAEMLAVSVRVFHGETSTVVRENPSLLQDAPLTARLGFPDVVFPGDRRNEAYIKLWSGEFYPFGNKMAGSAMKNIQVSAEVRTRDGQVVENVISRGAGESPVTQFDSMVFYHQNAPTWGELIKLQLPHDIMEDCHLFFSFRHRSSKEERAIGPTGSANAASSAQTGPQVHPNRPFAYAYLPLFESNRAFIPDGSHTLFLWRANRAPSQIGPDLYFNLPPIVQAGRTHDVVPASLAAIIQPLRDILTLRTFLVSTKYTQNDVLLKLLNWEKIVSDDFDELRSVLTKFTFVGEVEIVKFLRDIFDSLFGIAASPRNSQGELDGLTFNGLVTVLGIIQDRRFTNFRATLDVYIDRHFRFTTAHPKLISSMSKLLADPGRIETSKDLRAAIKVWPYLFKFIIRSRENQRGDRDLGSGMVSDHLETGFKRELNDLLRSINRLMNTTKPTSIIGTQTLALQHFAGIIADLSRVFTLDELVKISTSFADSVFITKGKMAVWKLLHILQICQGLLFEHHASRSQLIPSIVRWIRPHLGSYEESAHTSPNDLETSKDAARVAWFEGARLSVTILAVVLDRLQVSLVNNPKSSLSNDEVRQEQDNVDYILSMMPKLLQTYKEFDNRATIKVLERHRSPSTMASVVPVIFPSSYPFPLIAKRPTGNPAVASPARSSRRQGRRDRTAFLNCGMGEIASVLIVLVMLSPRKHLASFLDEERDLGGLEQSARLMSDFFEVSTSILSNEAYPSSWLNINILAHQMVLKMADPLASMMVRDFIPPADKSYTFNTTLWRSGLTMLLTLLSSEQLVIEQFKPQRRRAVWRLAGDIRGEGAQIFTKLWNSIGWPEQTPADGSVGASPEKMNTGGFQVQFVPSLVEPVLELCLSHHDELRTCAVRVLATMITSEWHLNGDFSVIEAEIIDKLDILFMADTKGDEISRAFFIGQLRSLFESPHVDERLREQVHACLVSVNRFLDLLLSVRSLPLEEGFEDDRIAGTLKLLGFLRQANRVTAFSTHVLRLVNLHLENHNYIEAALTLKLYADLHSWDMDSFVEPIPDLDLPRQSHFARKETLYMLILDYLGKGQAWEISVDICRELAQQYEYRSVNYLRLAEVLAHQANLYQKISSTERTFPAYFRVAYYGEQWPASLQGKMFVYRGLDWEKLAAFCDRMQSKHPKSILIKSNSDPGDEIRYADSQFLQITALQPEPDRTKDVFTNPEVPPIIRAYYEHSTTDLFSFTRPLQKSGEEESKGIGLNGDATAPDFTELWTEKTYLRCEDAFPTVLRRSEVAEIQVVEISPLENALNDVQAKQEELSTLEKKYSALGRVGGAKINTNRLSMALNGAVDAPVNGGIPLYKRAFFSPKYVSSNPDKEPLIHRLRDAIDEQALVVYRCIRLHAHLCPPEMRPFHETLERFFCQNFSEEIARLNLDTSRLGVDGPPLGASMDGGKGSLDGSGASLDGGGRAPERSASKAFTLGSVSRASMALESQAFSLDHNRRLQRVDGYEPGHHAVQSPLQRHITYLTKQASPSGILSQGESPTTTADSIAASKMTEGGGANSIHQGVSGSVSGASIAQSYTSRPQDAPVGVKGTPRPSSIASSELTAKGGSAASGEGREQAGGALSPLATGMASSSSQSRHETLMNDGPSSSRFAQSLFSKNNSNSTSSGAGGGNRLSKLMSVRRKPSAAGSGGH